MDMYEICYDYDHIAAPVVVMVMVVKVMVIVTESDEMIVEWSCCHLSLLLPV